jgi:hypothetical protein
MRQAEALTAIALLALGMLVCYEGIRMQVLGWGMSGPEPGLYPFLLGAGMVISGLLLLGRALLAARSVALDRPFIPTGGLRPVLAVGLPAAAMVILVPFVGLYLAAGLYLAIYMRWIGRRHWAVALAAAVLLPLAGYLVFERYFLIPLPEGSLTSQLPF